MSSTTVVKKTIRRTITSDGKEDVKETVSTERGSNYQLYRGMSPTTQNRLENRIQELEVELQQERAGHVRTQTEFTSIHIEIQSLQEKLELAEQEIANQIDIIRRRDQDVLKAKKDTELLAIQHEASEASLKKRFQDQINELSEQFERTSKAKIKVEKDKQHLVLEVEGLSIQIEEVKKAKVYAESKLETLDDQLRQLRLQLEEVTKSNLELTAIRNRLVQENTDLLRQLQDAEAKYSSVAQSKTLIQQKFDGAQEKLEEQKRINNQLEIQISTVTADFERARSSLDEQFQEILHLQAQLQNLFTENQSLKVRYEKDTAAKTEEFEEFRRKSTSRVTELEALLEQSKTKTTRLEREKSKLLVQIEEITIHFETAKSSLNEHIKLLKQAESSTAILQKRIDELNIELRSSNSDVKRFQTELIQSKQIVYDQQTRIDSLIKENQKLSDSFREFEITIKDLNRQQQEFLTVRSQLQTERDSLHASLTEASDVIRTLEVKLESSNVAINHLKIDIENITRSNGVEIENVRKSSQRTIDELHLQITELESRAKADSSRWKKKIESDQVDFQSQLDALNKTNAELAKVNKTLTVKLKDTEALLESERQTVERVTESVTISERKLVALQTEIEEFRIQLAVAEKARKKAESETAASKAHITEINVTIQTLTIEKRRLESDLVGHQREFDDVVFARTAAEERAEKLAADLTRLNDQLRFEQNNVTRAESKGKQLEAKIRDLTLHIEELESVPDGKRNITKLQSRISELEKELESEKRIGRELTVEIKKLQRQLSDVKNLADDEHRRVVDSKETVSTLEQKITTMKRQLQDSEEMVAITLAKYRRTQQLLEEAERRADMNINVIRQKTVVSAAGGSNVSVRRRSYSVTRETSGSSTSRAYAY